MALIRIVFALVVLALPSRVAAEEICVKYHKCSPLEQLKCNDITRSSFIHRICYLETKRYMIIGLGKQGFPRSEIPGRFDGKPLHEDAMYDLLRQQMSEWCDEKGNTVTVHGFRSRLIDLA